MDSKKTTQMEARKEEVKQMFQWKYKEEQGSVEIKDVQQLHSQSREEFETDMGGVGWDSGKAITLKERLDRNIVGELEEVIIIKWMSSKGMRTEEKFMQLFQEENTSWFEKCKFNINHSKKVMNIPLSVARNL